MRRDVDALFDRWAEEGSGKPLAVTGPHGCGKTRSVTDFLERSGLRYAVFDYETDGVAEVLAEAAPQRAAALLKRLREGLEEGDAVVIDGVRLREQAEASADALAELTGIFRVVAVGTVHGCFGDRFEEVRMGPMSFVEFLEAVGRPEMSWRLRNGNQCDARLADTLFAEYAAVGGLPGAVEAWRTTADENEADKAIRDVVVRIKEDVARAGRSSVRDASRVLDSIPEQLARRNRKFMFTKAVPGSRSKELAGTIADLEGLGVIRVVPIDDEDAGPNPSFKVYCFDTGVLRVLYGLPLVMAQRSRGSSEFVAGMTENAVILELERAGFEGIRCWRSGNKAEAEAVVTFGGGDVPIQIDMGDAFYARSLREFARKRDAKAMVYMCPSPKGDRDGVVVMPLYDACNLRARLEAATDN